MSREFPPLQSIDFHERGKRHKENVEKHLREVNATGEGCHGATGEVVRGVMVWLVRGVMVW